MPPGSTARTRTRALLPRGVLLSLSALCFATARPALAREYSTPVEVADEEELRQLWYDNLLDDEEFEVLLGLLEAPIDLNRAERQDLYQLPGIGTQLAEAIVDERVKDGPYELLTDLSTRVPGVTWQLLAAIDPFVVVRIPQGVKAPFRAHFDWFLYKSFDGVRPMEGEDYPAKSHTIEQLGWGKGPATALSFGGDVKGWLDFGVSGLAQEGIKTLEYEPESRDFYASWGVPIFRPHSGYLRIERTAGRLIVGSYHLHYGHGLVMSTISGRNRSGFYVRRTLGSGEDRIRDFDGLLGASARTTALKVGRGELDLSVFGSMRAYDVYSGDLGASGGARLDPLTDKEEIATPRIWIDGQRASYTTLPNAIRVGLLGGNLDVRLNRRTAIGFTGWGGFVDRTAIAGVEDSYELVLRKRWPTTVGMGAVGLHASMGVGLLDLSGEWAVSLGNDRPGQALYFLMGVEPSWGEFTFSLRHYDVAYVNPYNKGEAAADMVGGVRARGEQGMRFQAVIDPVKQIRFGFRFDLARNLVYDVFDSDLRFRVSGKPLSWLDLGIDGRWADHNLAVSGREHEYGGELDEELLGEYGALEDEFLDEDTTRAGQKLSLAGQLVLRDKKIGSLLFRYKRDWTDNRKKVQAASDQCDFRMQQGHSFRVQGRVKPHSTTTVAGAFRIFDEDVQGNRRNGAEFGSKALEGSLALEQKVAEHLKIKLRGKLGRKLSDAPSPCDQADEVSDGVYVPAEAIEYEPDSYDLRAFGEVLVSLQVKW
jgi:hypothetical protein